MQTKYLYVWSTSKRVRLAPWNRFKPSSKIFYWQFQGGTCTSFVDLPCFFLSCVCYAFVRVCLYMPCGHLLGKGWPLGSRLWCLTVSLSLPIGFWVRCGTWLYGCNQMRCGLQNHTPSSEGWSIAGTAPYVDVLYARPDWGYFSVQFLLIFNLSAVLMLFWPFVYSLFFA